MSYRLYWLLASGIRMELSSILEHVEFYSKNKFEKLVHLVGFIIRNVLGIYGMVSERKAAVSVNACNLLLYQFSGCIVYWAEVGGTSFVRNTDNNLSDYNDLTLEEFNICMPPRESYFLQRRILIQKRNNLQEAQKRTPPKEARKRRPGNVTQLRAHIVKLCRALSKDLCRKVVTNARVRLQEVVRQNGGHIEHVLH